MNIIFLKSNFCEMERNQIIDKINKEITDAANKGYSETYTLIFDKDYELPLLYLSRGYWGFKGAQIPGGRIT